MCQGSRGRVARFSSEGAGVDAGSETVGPFLNADIRTPFSSADVLKKCALIALHLIAEKGRGGEDGCHAPDLGVQRVQCGKVRAKPGQKTKACFQVTREGTVCNEALHVIGLYVSWWQDLSLSS